MKEDQHQQDMQKAQTNVTDQEMNSGKPNPYDSWVDVDKGTGKKLQKKARRLPFHWVRSASKSLIFIEKTRNLGIHLYWDSSTITRHHKERSLTL